MSFSIVNQNLFLCFWLSFSRCLCILMQIPLLNEMMISSVVKVLLSLMVTFALFPSIKMYMLQDLNFIGIENFAYLAIFNIVVGLMIGFLVRNITQIFISAASIIIQQVGLVMSRYFDPASGTQMGSFEKLISWTVLVIIVSSESLRPMLEGLLQTFYKIHIYDLGPLNKVHYFFLEMFYSFFESSIMLATPLIFVNLIIMSVLGVVSRMVPQMNVMMVSFVVNISLGLFVFSVISSEFFYVSFEIYKENILHWFSFLKG